MAIGTQIIRRCLMSKVRSSNSQKQYKTGLSFLDFGTAAWNYLPGEPLKLQKFMGFPSKGPPSHSNGPRLIYQCNSPVIRSAPKR